MTMQVKTKDGQWIDIGEIANGGLIEYRIKPQKRPDVVELYLRVTLDGGTGKLIKAEVL